MNLADLKPILYRHAIEPAPDYIGRKLEDGSMQWGGWPHSVFHPVKKLAEADRLVFLCPRCFAENGGPKGTHRVAVDFEGRGTPDDACCRGRDGKAVRWAVSGKRLDDLTVSPSILMLSGCKWHGWVRNGQIVHA